MSPHAVSASDVRQGLLDEYSVTRNGFIPAEKPLASLPHDYYQPWERILHRLPSLIEHQTLRAEVNDLPVLTTTRLTTEAEWRRAYVVLGFLTHAYIWGGKTASEILPASISVPLVKVSSHLEIPPVATYAALNLWNFTGSSPDISTLDSLCALHTFTGTQDESWFYMVSVAMETRGAQIIPVLLRALDAVKRRDYATITRALKDLVRCIHDLGAILDRMYEKCDPLVFYHSIRPFLAGSKNMEASGLPRGVFYEYGNGKGEWMQFRGGSNGQSSLIQLLDIALGVEHKSEGSSNPEGSRSQNEDTTARVLSFHEEVRHYMPGPHRRLLEHASRMGSIRNLAASAGSSPEAEVFRGAFRDATRAMVEFRNKHLQIVTRYIVIPSGLSRSDGKQNLATTSTRLMRQEKDNVKSQPAAQLTGTGGTALLPFLKQSRDETRRAGDLSDIPLL